MQTKLIERRPWLAFATPRWTRPRTPRRGTDRRQHTIFVTKNSEYHCRDDVCVAVRELRTGEFRDDHPAIGRRMMGGVGVSREGELTTLSRRGEKPHRGESLFFFADSIPYPLRTSPLRAIRRPSRDIVDRYPR